MADYGRISKSIVKAIADALRFCNGNEAQYTPGQMPNAVRLLKKRLTQKTITRNGVYIPTSGYDGFDRVTVNVEGGGGDAVLVSKNITASGNYSPVDDNADGYSFVSVAVPGTVLQTKTATANGTVTPDTGYDGMSSVEVAVPNTYSAADNGKVVSGGQLVAQTARAAAITQNGTFDTTENNSVTVNVSGGGTPEAPYNDVIFIDYDGTIVNSYSAADFANLSALPSNPSHTGLTAQGWNWTLANAKAHVAKYGKLVIGQMYITNDGKTRIFIHLDQGRLSPYLGIAVNGTAVIEWGDGNSDTVTGSSESTIVNTQHNYAAPGDFIIAITATGAMTIKGSTTNAALVWKNGASLSVNRYYIGSIKKIELGNNVKIGSMAFAYCNSLSEISIPKSITSIGTNAFSSCYSLASITIPDSLTVIENNEFQACHILKLIALSNSVSAIKSNTFSNCYSLSAFSIPESITSIGISAFPSCFGLATIIIPESVTSIGSKAFNSCTGLSEIHFASATPPAVSNVDAWNYIQEDCKIYVPAGTLSAYTSAANYPDPATYTYIEE